MAFEPLADDLALFTDVDAIAAWIELDPATLDAVAAAAGATTTRALRTWARIPGPRWDQLIASTTIDDNNGGTRGLTAVEEGQVGELRSILQKLAQSGPSPATASGNEDQLGQGPLARYCHRPPARTHHSGDHRHRTRGSTADPYGVGDERREGHGTWGH